ncbi:MAG: NUDIX hydrolase [Solirubrobacteraceae bacterium]|nr:NUDIX hydrolase [Solirubrobacteraceae bacterium]
MSQRFERLTGETVFRGRIFDVVRERFQFEDGEIVERENVVHGGAVAIVAYDEDTLFLVRQPREIVGRSDILEICAGRLDQPGESPQDCAKRELAEELGLAADAWEHATTYFTSVGFSNEELHVFFATGLTEVERPENDEEDERIEVVRWPLDELDAAIDATTDSKTLIGLLLFRRARESG